MPQKKEHIHHHYCIYCNESRKLVTVMMAADVFMMYFCILNIFFFLNFCVSLLFYSLIWLYWEALWSAPVFMCYMIKLMLRHVHTLMVSIWQKVEGVKEILLTSQTNKEGMCEAISENSVLIHTSCPGPYTHLLTLQGQNLWEYEWSKWKPGVNLCVSFCSTWKGDGGIPPSLLSIA